MTSQRGKIRLHEHDLLASEALLSLTNHYLNVYCASSSFPQLYHNENATMAGICNKHTCNAYADPISILNTQ